MAKLHKAEIYMLDVNEMYNSLEEIIGAFDWHIDDINFHSYDGQSVEIEWDDDIDLNRNDCKRETYEKYFKK